MFIITCRLGLIFEPASSLAQQDLLVICAVLRVKYIGIPVEFQISRETVYRVIHQFSLLLVRFVLYLGTVLVAIFVSTPFGHLWESTKLKFAC